MNSMIFCSTILLYSILMVLCGAAAAQPTAGTIEISDQTPIPTKGIFRNARSVVFCSEGNTVDFDVKKGGQGDLFG